MQWQTPCSRRVARDPTGCSLRYQCLFFSELVGLGLITAMCLLIGDYKNQKAGPMASG